jgi:hypothetical protein
LFALASGELADTRAALLQLADSLAKECHISFPEAKAAASGFYDKVRHQVKVATTGSHISSNASTSSSSSSSSSKSYAEAANTATFEKVLCGMPDYVGSINGVEFIICADSGCESSTISTKELERKWDVLFAPGSQVRLIDLAEPVAVSMYAGGNTVYARQVLANVPIDIGIGRFYVDLLVVPDCGYPIKLA